MPIHDQSYRHYGGRRRAPGRAWMVIAWAGIRSILARRILLALLIFAWAPFVVRAVQFFLPSAFPQAADFLAPTVETYRDFMRDQLAFVFFVTIFVGAGLIANDRRANALQLYLSKPLTRVEYVAGKLAILSAFLLLVTWIPGMLLLLLQMMLEGSFTFIRENAFLFPAITGIAFLVTFVSAFAILALSALTKNGRFAGILYAFLFIFTQGVFTVFENVTRGSEIAWISFKANLEQVSDVLFRMQPSYDTPWGVSLGVLLAIVALAILVLNRRVRGVEVVT